MATPVQAQVQETAPALVEANVFELRRGKTRITFREGTADAVRKPVLEYDDGQGEPRVYTGDQIRQEQTALGRLLSVERALVDVRAPTMTLVLPRVLLERTRRRNSPHSSSSPAGAAGPSCSPAPSGPAPWRPTTSRLSAARRGTLSARRSRGRAQGRRGWHLFGGGIMP
jgi:hypothetical protein